MSPDRPQSSCGSGQQIQIQQQQTNNNINNNKMVLSVPILDSTTGIIQQNSVIPTTSSSKLVVLQQSHDNGGFITSECEIRKGVIRDLILISCFIRLQVMKVMVLVILY